MNIRILTHNRNDASIFKLWRIINNWKLYTGWYYIKSYKKEYYLKKKILITTGGSGGHVIPALNFYKHLIQNNDVFLISDLRGFRFIDKNIYNYKIIDVPDIKKNLFKIPFNILFFLISIIKSFFYFRKNKIDKIISTGGYMTFPILYSFFTYKV